MSVEHQGLVDLVHLVEALGDYAESRPLDYLRWTAPQVRYLSSRHRRKLLRTGNRVGKSFVALADVALRATKRHPFRPDWNARRGPVHQWIVTVSWSQAIPLMTIFRSFLGENDLVSAPSWDPARGWGKAAPTLVFPDGSTVGWRTMRQGPRAHAGAELDHILVDEPCAVEHYRELERRVLTRAGELSLALTPVNAPGDLTWLQDLATEKIVQDLHFRMEEELFRYVDDGSLRKLPDGTVCDAAWIEEQAKGVPARWREIVVHGGWEEVVTGGTFTEVFDRDKHVAEFTLDGKELLKIGFDHGTQAFTETAVLVAVDRRHEYPHVYVVDCYEAPADSPPEADAKAVVAMLARHGRTWRALKKATGDIAHYGGRGRWNRKSNKELAYELARAMGLPKGAALTPPIWTAKTGEGSSPKGSVNRGIGWLYRAMLRPGQFTIHPRCEAVAVAIERHVGGSEDPYGHLVDALRYAVDEEINRGQTRQAAPVAVRVTPGR